MKLLNSIHEDYHIHSINYSDGMNTIDEITQYAGKIGMKKIAITDHSQAALEKAGIFKSSSITATKYWKNVHNNVEVLFGVEGDLLNANGDCCFSIWGMEPEYAVLSAHADVFQSPRQDLTQAYINAIERHHDRIQYIAHICKKSLVEYLDLPKIINLANKYHIPLEFNAKNLVYDRTDLTKLNLMLNLADQVYINSDGHMFAEWDKSAAFDHIKKGGFEKQ